MINLHKRAYRCDVGLVEHSVVGNVIGYVDLSVGNMARIRVHLQHLSGRRSATLLLRRVLALRVSCRERGDL